MVSLIPSVVGLTVLMGLFGLVYGLVQHAAADRAEQQRRDAGYCRELKD
jgi:hypothetical protein